MHLHTHMNSFKASSYIVNVTLSFCNCSTFAKNCDVVPIRDRKGETDKISWRNKHKNFKLIKIERQKGRKNLTK